MGTLFCWPPISSLFFSSHIYRSCKIDWKEEKYENKKWNRELENVYQRRRLEMYHTLFAWSIALMCGMRKARVSNFQVKTFKKKTKDLLSAKTKRNDIKRKKCKDKSKSSESFKSSYAAYARLVSSVVLKCRLPMRAESYALIILFMIKLSICMLPVFFFFLLTIFFSLLYAEFFRVQFLCRAAVLSKLFSSANQSDDHFSLSWLVCRWASLHVYSNFEWK